MDDRRFNIDVVLWAISFRRVITVEDILTRWSVSRATAFRWRAPLNDARERQATSYAGRSNSPENGMLRESVAR